jgi:hypothetical protein
VCRLRAAGARLPRADDPESPLTTTGCVCVCGLVLVAAQKDTLSAGDLGVVYAVHIIASLRKNDLWVPLRCCSRAARQPAATVLPAPSPLAARLRVQGRCAVHVEARASGRQVAAGCAERVGAGKGAVEAVRCRAMRCHAIVAVVAHVGIAMRVARGFFLKKNDYRNTPAFFAALVAYSWPAYLQSFVQRLVGEWCGVMCC